MLMKRTQQRESAEMKTDIHKLQTKLQLVEKENIDLKSEVRELKKVVSSYMDPQLKEQVVNTVKAGSIEEDVQMNKEDIIDLRINDGHHDMQIGQMLNQINNINTTLNGEIVKLDERITERITHVEERVTNVEERLTNEEEFGLGLQKEVEEIYGRLSKAEEIGSRLQEEVGEIDGRLSKAEMRTAVCGVQDSMSMSSSTTLTFDRVHDEINSGGVLAESGYFTATIEGVYLVTLKTTVYLVRSQELYGNLKLSSGGYNDNNEDRFIESSNHVGRQQ